MIMFCEGCGEAVVVNLAEGPVSTTRDPEPSSSPGRATIRQGEPARTVHRCADGTYVPPDQKAAPKRM